MQLSVRPYNFIRVVCQWVRPLVPDEIQPNLLKALECLLPVSHEFCQLSLVSPIIAPNFPSFVTIIVLHADKYARLWFYNNCLHVYHSRLSHMLFVRIQRLNFSESLVK